MRYEPNYSSKAKKDATLIAMQPPFSIHQGILIPNPKLPVESQIEPVLFVLCCWGEARGEIDEGKRQVALTIMNRYYAQREYWGKSVRDVILQRDRNNIFQFSCMKPGDPNYKKMLKPDLISYFKVMREVLNIYLIGQHEEEKPSLYYKVIDLSTTSFWNRLKPVKAIGKHQFYTD